MWHSCLFIGLSVGGCLWVAEKPFALPNKEMGYLWDRGNPQPFLSFSIMETNTENTSNAPGSSLVNAKKTRITTWADRVEEFSSNLNEKNAFSNDDGARFFIIKRNENDFSKTSPFLIQKAIESIVGEPRNIKKLRSGELLIELKTNLQASKLMKCTLLANIPVTVSAHRSLNSCHGVISESDLQYVPETELLENLKDQKVIEVK